MDFIQIFRQNMICEGVKIQDEIIPDGKIHRFHISGDDPSSKNGWYVLHNNAVSCGVYGCWKRGIKKSWCSKSKKHMTFNEWNLLQQHNLKTKNHFTELQKKASVNAKIIWKQSRPAENTHSYLIRKQVASYGLRVDKYNRLVIPILDSNDDICSLQFIATSGEKRFFKSGNTSGGYFIIGKQKHPSDPIFIGEGYATCASIFEITKYTVVCCFNCNNILAVTRLIRTKFPKAEIIIAADNDAFTIGNPGLAKGRDAATKCSVDLVYPDFTGLNIESKPSDFNDLMLLSGIDRVKNNLMTRQHKEVE